MSSGKASALGATSIAVFLRRYWHKQALLIRAARPGFTGWLERTELIALACRDDVESRLAIRERQRWVLTEGPFRRGDFKGLPSHGWTLLVQGVNLVDVRGDALLREFAFIPYARLDDLMVSYAAPGGGVGPHFDSYDVFLLQGFGRRRWRYGRQRDLSLAPDAPLKILARFKGQHEAILAPGDMLYLPPHYAHDGVAMDACTTYSIGFRAVAYTELAQALLDDVRDAIELPGRYADPDLIATRHPARIDGRMQRRIVERLGPLHLGAPLVKRFLGRYLTEPKPHVRFDRPQRMPSVARFRHSIAKGGVVLDPRTQLLYDTGAFYLNGEDVKPPVRGAEAIAKLANARRLLPRDCASLPSGAIRFLHAAYGHGFLDFGS